MDGGRVGVLIVDDQAPFRRAAARLVASVEGFVVLGVAHSGEEAVDLVATLEPDLILMDVRLHAMSGPEATRIIVAAHPAITVLLVSTHRRDELPNELETCGASAFFAKEELSAEVLERYGRRSA